MHSSLFGPIVALVVWSLVMCAWLYATRIPAITRLKIVYDPTHPDAEFHARLPPQVRWKADNYNNLMEQPTLFYAVAVTLALLGADGGLNTALAWSYVVLRAAHSLVQATINTVMFRFALFISATLVLVAMTIRAALIVF
ncbi:MAG: MAPEG family protein [Rhizomicrobium sp.]